MEKKRKWQLLSLCIPAFLLIVIFMIVPLGNAVKVSFFKWNGSAWKIISPFSRIRFSGGPL